MITAPQLATTPPAAAFVPTSMSIETVSAGPDGATGEWMRGRVKIDMDLRAAATGVAQAFEGSNILTQAVPFTPGDVADGTSRIVLEDAAGTKLAYTEPDDAPDHPADAKLKAALNAYMETTGLGDVTGGL